MKRTVILPALIGVVLTCSVAVYAGVDKIWLRPMALLPTAEGGIHANATGFVTVQTVKGGGAQVSVQLRRAAPDYLYVVKSKGQVLGTFTTDAKGSGVLNLYVADPGTTLGQYINVWQTAGLTQTDFETYGLLFGQRY